MKIDRIFLGKVAEQKKLRKLSNKKLSEMTGIPKNTIDAFTGGFRDSDKTADAIAKVLNIER